MKHLAILATLTLTGCSWAQEQYPPIDQLSPELGITQVRCLDGKGQVAAQGGIGGGGVSGDLNTLTIVGELPDGTTITCDGITINVGDNDD